MAKKKSEEAVVQTAEEEKERSKGYSLDSTLPDIVNAINKEAKVTKITTLAKAKSFQVKRFPSGSFGIDNMIGGGYAFRRMMMLYGHKSCGKNSHLYQTIALNQRICRHCGGILPGFMKEETSTHNIVGIDRWATILYTYMGFPICDCARSTGRITLFYDFEKSLGIEAPKNKLIKKVTNKKSGEVIDEDAYDQVLERIAELTKQAELLPEDKDELKVLDKFVNEHNVEVQTVPMLSPVEYLPRCGVDIEKLLVADPAHAEECTNSLGDVIPSQEVDIIIIDSLQSMLPKYVKERDAEEATMGVEAKANALLARQVCSAYAATDVTDEREAYKPALFLISQVRAVIGTMSKAPPSFSGGNAIAHHVSLALEFKRENFLKFDGTDSITFTDTFYGQKVRVRAEKNKLSAPGDFAEYNFYFRDSDMFSMGEVDHVGEITQLGIARGVIQRKGTWYVFDKEQFQGKLALDNYMRQHPEFVGQIYKQVLKTQA